MLCVENEGYKKDARFYRQVLQQARWICYALNCFCHSKRKQKQGLHPLLSDNCECHSNEQLTEKSSFWLTAAEGQESVMAGKPGSRIRNLRDHILTTNRKQSRSGVKPALSISLPPTSPHKNLP